MLQFVFYLGLSRELTEQSRKNGIIMQISTIQQTQIVSDFISNKFGLISNKKVLTNLSELFLVIMTFIKTNSLRALFSASS